MTNSIELILRKLENSYLLEEHVAQLGGVGGELQGDLVEAVLGERLAGSAERPGVAPRMVGDRDPADL